MKLYVDTSALIKRYISEPHSDAFEAYLMRFERAFISRLTVVELRCALARRRRAHDITPSQERSSLTEFEDDLKVGALEVWPLLDTHAIAAHNLIGKFSSLPLRTLDAMHLAIALDQETEVVVTADQVMAKAARVAGMQAKTFF